MPSTQAGLPGRTGARHDAYCTQVPPNVGPADAAPAALGCQCSRLPAQLGTRPRVTGCCCVVPATALPQ
eukprot:COSAG01_NODE_38519_length_488_cov_2.519280_1_plen_68_part_10